MARPELNSLRPNVALLMFALFIASPAFSQETIDLHLDYSPNTKYHIVAQTSQTGNFDFIGDINQLPRHLQGRVPARTESTQTLTYSVRTGKLSADGGFPIEIEILENKTLASFNGSKMLDISKNEGMQQGITILGFMHADKRMEYQGTKGKTLTHDEETIMKQVFTQSAPMSLSAKGMKIGESVSYELPMQVPYSQGTVNLQSQMIFELTSIDGDLANFDISGDAVLRSTSGIDSVTFTVDGSGFMIYDHSKHYSPEIVSKSAMTVRSPIGGGELVMSFSGEVSTVTTLQSVD